MSALLLSTAASPAPIEQKFDFDIPRTTRAQAVKAIGKQGDFGISYYSDDNKQAEALVNAIEGSYTRTAAIEMALRSSTLDYRWIEPDMLVVSDVPVASGPAQTARTVTAPAQPREREEITVTSGPLPSFSSDFVPKVTFDRKDIDAVGAQSVYDVLRLSSPSAFSRAEGYYASGAQYAEMRGLGPEATLILINGRRAFPSANSIASSAFDLNSIPIAAIERIEILPNAGAAWYGADGIGGTVNIVTRQRIDTPWIGISYGGAAGGAELRGVTLAFGTEGDRLNSAFVVDHLDFGGLLGAARSRWSNQDYRDLGGQDLRSPVSPSGNIFSTGGWNLPGLSSPMAAVPLTDSTPGISLDDFIGTAGTLNLESLLRYESIVPESTRTSIVGSVSYRLTDRITASFDLMFADRTATFYLPPPMMAGILAPASNAYNPFGVGVVIYRLLTEAGQQYQYLETRWLRTGAALHGSWTHWEWEVSVVHSQEHASVWIENELDFNTNGAARAALDSSDSSHALNPFQSGPVGSRSLLTQLIAPRDTDEFGSSGQQVIAYLEGQLWSLPAGALTAKLGGEWRRESSLFEADLDRRFNVDREIASGFLQVHVPLLKELPAIDELRLTADVRLDSYEGMSHASHSKLGLQWKPHPSLTVHASQSHTFRPPSLYETYLPKLVTSARIVDPVRREAVFVPVTTGGNRSLQASDARSWTAGFAFSPETAMNWTVSADYWRVAANQLITSLPPETVLANEDLFFARVIRAAPTEAGPVGQLISVDSSRINAASLEASGVDILLSADFLTDLGRFKPQLCATWFDTFHSAELPGQPKVDRVNVKSEFGSILEWRAIASLQWRQGPYELTALARYTPSYDDAFAGEPTGRKIYSLTLFDLHGSINFERLLGAKSLFRGRLRVGVFNVTDAEPGFSRAGSAFDYSQGDLKGRTYYARVEKDF